MFNQSNSDRPGQDKIFQIKLLFYALLTGIIFIILLFRIGYLQIVKQAISYERVKQNREKIIRIPPIRGKIYSADNYLLAKNKKSYDLYIEPANLHKDFSLRQKELVYLARILAMDYAEIEEIIQAQSRNQKEILIKENISFSQYVKIMENFDKLPGVNAKNKLVRYYPHHDLLSHTIGYIGSINQNEFAIFKKSGYHANDWIGKSGVEKTYESLLRGKSGLQVLEIDAHMNIIQEKEKKEALPGDELVLSIDLAFQKEVEAILADRMGTIIVMKPANGEIIAQVSYPDFDPNIYIIPSDANYQAIKKIDLDTKGTPLINRNIQAEYPPGSIFKMVSSFVILQENVVSPYKKYYCDGDYHLNREKFGCWNVHHYQNLEESIYNSCDVYYYNTCQLIGIERIHRYATGMGFGQLLNVDLPFEQKGLIPSKNWMKSKGETWHLGYTLLSAIGQGDVKATPLQMANYFSVISNKGYSYQPHVLREIRDSFTGEIKEKIKPEKIIDFPLKDNAWDFVHQSLRKTVTLGTAKGAFYSNPYQFAGKTGTAEIGFGPKKQTHSVFGGFGPLDYPLEEQIVVVVYLEFSNGQPLKYAASLANLVFYSYYEKTSYEETAKRFGYPVKESYNE